MDTNQLVAALTQLAAAARPEPKYCLFWIESWEATCMTRAEWSGWMQAFGSMAALAIAIALPYWQKWRVDKENFERARQCLLMQCALINVLGEEAKASKNGIRAAVAAAQIPCANLLMMFDEVRPPKLSLGQLAIWRSARTTVAQLNELISHVRAATIADFNVGPALDLLMKASRDQLEGFGLKANLEHPARQ